jgi:outer membrane immunogenic protein
MKLNRISLAIITAAALCTSSAMAGHYKGEENYKPMAAAPCNEKVLHDGFYLGGQVGYDSYRTRANIGGTAANPALSATGFVGGLFAGYGQYFSDFYYLGAEIFADYSNASSTFNATDGGTDTVSLKHTAYGSYGISLLPGLKVNTSTLAYLRLGYNTSRLKGQDSANGVYGSGSVSKSNWSNGFNYGIGLETAVYQNWSVRGEYSHTDYSSFRTPVTKYSPSNNQFMVGVLYHFA